MGNRKCQVERIFLSHLKYLTLSAEIERNKGVVVDRSHLWLSELSEIGCQAIVINVAVGLYSHIQDMDRLILDTLGDKANTHFILRCTVIQVNDWPLTIRSLFSSPCCPLHHTGQDYLPLGRLDLGEESQRSSLTRLICSCRRRKITHAINHTWNMIFINQWNISKLRTFL